MRQARGAREGGEGRGDEGGQGERMREGRREDEGGWVRGKERRTGARRPVRGETQGRRKGVSKGVELLSKARTCANE